MGNLKFLEVESDNFIILFASSPPVSRSSLFVQLRAISYSWDSESCAFHASPDLFHIEIICRAQSEIAHFGPSWY